MHCEAFDIVCTKEHAHAAMKNLNTYEMLQKDFQSYTDTPICANIPSTRDPDLYPHPDGLDWFQISCCYC